jgi:ribosomal protein S18 acetylase RimI-like enzyme
LSLLARLQSGLGELAAADREHVPVGPLDGYVDHVRTTKHHSFAIPRAAAAPAEMAAALAPLRAAFAEHRRNARVEFIEEVTPGLEAIMLADGWTRSERMPVMVCIPDTFVAPPAADDVVVELLPPDCPEDRLLGFVRVQRECFDDDSPITEAEVVGWRSRAASSVYAAGLLAGAVVGTALCMPISAEGITEVGGVATTAAFRGRGIGATVTAAAVAAAFAAGATVAWLTASDDRSQGIYARAGFSVEGTLLAYDAPAAGTPRP